MRVRVRDVMTSEVVTVDQDAPFKVVDPAGPLLGIVSRSDLLVDRAYGLRRRR